MIKFLFVAALAAWAGEGVAASVCENSFGRAATDLLSAVVSNSLDAKTVLSALHVPAESVVVDNGRFVIHRNFIALDAEIVDSRTEKAGAESRLFLQPDGSDRTSEDCFRRNDVGEVLLRLGFKLVRGGFVDTWLGYAGDSFSYPEKNIRVIVRYAVAVNECVALIQLYQNIKTTNK